MENSIKAKEGFIKFTSQFAACGSEGALLPQECWQIPQYVFYGALELFGLSWLPKNTPYALFVFWRAFSLSALESML